MDGGGGARVSPLWRQRFFVQARSTYKCTHGVVCYLKFEACVLRKHHAVEEGRLWKDVAIDKALEAIATHHRGLVLCSLASPHNKYPTAIQQCDTIVSLTFRLFYLFSVFSFFC